jgi:hypothetical protein
VTDEPPAVRPHGDPLVPHHTPREAGEPTPETPPQDLPAPQPEDGPDRSGDEDPGAGAD